MNIIPRESNSLLQILICILAVVSIVGCQPDTERDAIYESQATRSEAPIEELVIAPVTVREMDEAFTREFPLDVVYALNEVKKSRISFDVLELVRCVYLRCDSSLSKYSKTSFDSDVVRVNLLDVLVQATGQGFDEQDGIDYREDAIRFLTNDDPTVVQRALMVLSFLDGPENVSIISDVAIHTGNDRTFRYAIAALRFMSVPEAQSAIDEILTNSSPDRVELVTDPGLQ